MNILWLQLAQLICPPVWRWKKSPPVPAHPHISLTASMDWALALTFPIKEHALLYYVFTMSTIKIRWQLENTIFYIMYISTNISGYNFAPLKMCLFVILKPTIYMLFISGEIFAPYSVHIGQVTRIVRRNSHSIFKNKWIWISSGWIKRKPDYAVCTEDILHI